MWLFVLLCLCWPALSCLSVLRRRKSIQTSGERWRDDTALRSAELKPHRGQRSRSRVNPGSRWRLKGKVLRNERKKGKHRWRPKEMECQGGKKTYISLYTSVFSSLFMSIFTKNTENVPLLPITYIYSCVIWWWTSILHYNYFARSSSD